MFSKVYSGGIQGVEGFLVSVEADVSDGLPSFGMVGYLSAEVREAQDRVRTALRNSGYRLPPKRITVNLSPADIRKGGTAFDLPIAVAVLASTGFLDSVRLKESGFVGELGLDGGIKSVRGVLSIVSEMQDHGLKRCFLPKANELEGRAVGGICVVGVETLEELVRYLEDPEALEKAPYESYRFLVAKGETYEIDYAEVTGQKLLKRATEIAVAGRHNILYIGSAGTGKTMIAQRIPTIMPALTLEESIETSKIYSICGLLPTNVPLISKRPFRSPHHTISAQGLIGGGRVPKPGEISLASNGVLFLDEFPEFQKHIIETLREPLEEHTVTITRLHGSFEFPARILLAAAMNPCNCGFYPDKNRCRCSETQVKHYLSKISKPLLDRIDICVEASPISYDELQKTEINESSAQIRERVEHAVQIQRERFFRSNISYNSEMKGGQRKEYCKLKEAEQLLMRQLFASMNLSARAYEKILKVARTIADLDGSLEIEREHLCEAVGYRGLEQRFFGGN